jgi:hypothetical protein
MDQQIGIILLTIYGFGREDGNIRELSGSASEMYSEMGSYYSDFYGPIIPRPSRPNGALTLDALALDVDDIMDFTYDFGDNHTITISVEDISERPDSVLPEMFQGVKVKGSDTPAWRRNDEEVRAAILTESTFKPRQYHRGDCDEDYDDDREDDDNDNDDIDDDGDGDNDDDVDNDDGGDGFIE